MVQVNFIMIYLIHKISVLLKIKKTLKHFLEDNIIKDERNLYRSKKLKKRST